MSQPFWLHLYWLCHSRKHEEYQQSPSRNNPDLLCTHLHSTPHLFLHMHLLPNSEKQPSEVRTLSGDDEESMTTSRNVGSYLTETRQEKSNKSVYQSFVIYAGNSESEADLSDAASWFYTTFTRAFVVKVRGCKILAREILFCGLY